MDKKSNADLMLQRVLEQDARDTELGIVRPESGPPLERTVLTLTGIPRETMTKLQALAHRSGTSVSALGLLAVEQLLEKAATSPSSSAKRSRQVN